MQKKIVIFLKKSNKVWKIFRWFIKKTFM